MNYLLLVFLFAFNFQANCQDVLWECTCGVQATFPGGMQSLKKYFVDRIDVTNSEFSDLKGDHTCYISFTVTEEGFVKDIRILQGISPAFDWQLAGLLAAMPRWEPSGNGCGEFYSTNMRIPIKIRLP